MTQVAGQTAGIADREADVFNALSETGMVDKVDA